MARLWQSGFELNSLAVENFSAIGSHMSLVTTGSPRSGTYHAEATGFASGAAQGDAYQFVSAAGNGPYFFKFAFKYATAPSADNVIFRATNALSSGTVAAVKLTSAGQLKLWQGSTGGSQVGSNSATLTANTYYEIEVKFNKTGAGTDTLEARLNGTVFATASNLTLVNPILAANYGGNLFVETQTTGDWFFDDLAINDSTGSFQTGYPGSEKIIHLLPNAAGDVNTFATQTGGTAGSTNNFTRVNEVTPDDATTFNGSSVLNQEDLFNVANSGIGASDTVNVVMVGGRFRNNTADATTAFKFEIEKAAGDTITQSAAIIPNSTTWQTDAKAAPFNYPLVTYQDPSSANWTQTTLDSMQVGYKLTAANINRVDISTIWVSVAYVPASTTTTSTSSSTSTSSTSSSTSISTSTSSTSISTSSTSTSTSISSTSSSTSLSTSTSISSTSSSTSVSTSTSISSTSSSTSLSTSSTSSSTSLSTSSTSSSTSTSSTSSSTSISTSSTSTSVSTSTSLSTSSTSTSTTVSLTTSTSSTSSSISTSSTSSSTSTSTSVSSTSASTSISTSSTSSSTSTTHSTSSTSSSTSKSTSSTSSSTSTSTSVSSTSSSTSTSFSTSSTSTSKSTSTSSTSSSTSTSLSTSSTSSSTSTTVSFTTSTSSTSTSSTSSSTSSTTTLIDLGFIPRVTIHPQPLTTTVIQATTALVDDASVLVDDVNTQVGSQLTPVANFKVRVTTRLK